MKKINDIITKFFSCETPEFYKNNNMILDVTLNAYKIWNDDLRCNSDYRMNESTLNFDKPKDDCEHSYELLLVDKFSIGYNYTEDDEDYSLTLVIERIHNSTKRFNIKIDSQTRKIFDDFFYRNESRDVMRDFIYSLIDDVALSPLQKNCLSIIVEGLNEIEEWEEKDTLILKNYINAWTYGLERNTKNFIFDVQLLCHIFDFTNKDDIIIRYGSGTNVPVTVIQSIEDFLRDFVQDDDLFKKYMWNSKDKIRLIEK